MTRGTNRYKRSTNELHYFFFIFDILGRQVYIGAYNDSLFQQLIFLDPKIVLYNEDKLKIRDFTFTATRIGNIDITKLAYEWRILPSFYNDLQKDELTQLEIDVALCGIRYLSQ